MKTYTLDKYGDPHEVLKMVSIELPQPRHEEVLIKVKCSAINDFDWCLTTGTPFSYRAFFGLFKPKKSMRFPGMEVSGVVEAVGAGITGFKKGDRVYGDTSDFGFGSLSEYMAVNAQAVRPIPEGMSFKEAVSLPHASALAIQGLVDLGRIQQGEKVLINGGGGGVGILGAQIAKTYGAHVTGIDSVTKLEAMKAAGFDELIDYQTHDFTGMGELYDLILDCRTSRFPGSHLKALKPKGRYVSIGGESGKLLFMVAASKPIEWATGKKLKMVAMKANKDLDLVEKLFFEGKLNPVIDGPFSFQNVPDAIKKFGEAKHIGKVVVSMEE
jgi:NADPH:quinone reductase-like Zn-dependent oxidoreductase